VTGVPLSTLMLAVAPETACAAWNELSVAVAEIGVLLEMAHALAAELPLSPAGLVVEPIIPAWLVTVFIATAAHEIGCACVMVALTSR